MRMMPATVTQPTPRATTPRHAAWTTPRVETWTSRTAIQGVRKCEASVQLDLVDLHDRGLACYVDTEVSALDGLLHLASTKGQAALFFLGQDQVLPDVCCDRFTVWTVESVDEVIHVRRHDADQTPVLGRQGVRGLQDHVLAESSVRVRLNFFQKPGKPPRGCRISTRGMGSPVKYALSKSPHRTFALRDAAKLNTRWMPSVSTVGLSLRTSRVSSVPKATGRDFKSTGTSSCVPSPSFCAMGLSFSFLWTSIHLHASSAPSATSLATLGAVTRSAGACLSYFCHSFSRDLSRPVWTCSGASAHLISLPRFWSFCDFPMFVATRFCAQLATDSSCSVPDHEACHCRNCPAASTASLARRSASQSDMAGSDARLSN